MDRSSVFDFDFETFQCPVLRHSACTLFYIRFSILLMVVVSLVLFFFPSSFHCLSQFSIPISLAMLPFSLQAIRLLIANV